MPKFDIRNAMDQASPIILTIISLSHLIANLVWLRGMLVDDFVWETVMWIISIRANEFAYFVTVLIVADIIGLIFGIIGWIGNDKKNRQEQDL